MAQLIAAPIVISSPGSPPKRIEEFVGLVATQTPAVSVAVMESPTGWSEPGQRPQFDEYTLVLAGQLTVETEDGSLLVTSGQALHAPAGQWVRYSTPIEGGARCVSVCLPAFSPDTVHRDTTETSEAPTP